VVRATVVLAAVTLRDGASDGVSDAVGATGAMLAPVATLVASITPARLLELEPRLPGEAIVVSSPVGAARLLLLGGPVTMASVITRPIMATAAIALEIARPFRFHEDGRGGGGYRYCKYCSGVGKGDGSTDSNSGD
jgi:hypothetical protein